MKACPADGSALRRLDHGAVPIHTCDHCNGFWLALADLKGCSTAGSQPRTGQVRVSIARRRGPRQCADCATTLSPRRIEGVVVDVCRRCRSLWLDAGELELIVARHRTKPKRAASARWLDGYDATELVGAILEHAPGLVESGGDAAQAIAEFIGEVIAGIFS